MDCENVKEKTPGAVLDYKFDWAPFTNGAGKPTDWLDTANGEVIITKAVTADAGITVDLDVLTDNDTSVTVWLSGGTAGINYDVVCSITTNSAIPRTDSRKLIIRMVSNNG